jgi:2-iminobutanoate/2-iminopropanoate deaminase
VTQQRGRRVEYRVAGQAEPISHFTDAVAAGGLLFVSGIVPVDENRELVGGGDDVVAQARKVFDNMAEVLSAAGCSFEDVVKVTLFLTDVADRPLINPVREEVFGETRPASTLVEVSALVIPGARIEVDCVAVLP